MQASKPFDAGRREFVTQSSFALLTTGLGVGPLAKAAGSLATAVDSRTTAAGPRAAAPDSHAGAEAPADRATAASMGIDPRGIDAFLDAVAAGSFELHSLVVARHGKIAASGWCAPYRQEAPCLLYSLSKSFTSTAVGFAVSEGKLRVTDKVVDFFPSQLPPTVSANLAALNVEHLLTMSVGMPKDATPAVTHEHDWVKTFLQQPIEFRPGSVFLYNSAATYMLSAIVQKVTGQQVNHYLRPRFFAELGIPEMNWQVCPLGINTGGWGLSATTETLMKFGQFYLQQGRWNGRQLLPKKWIAQATRRHILQTPPAGKDPHTDDWFQGYGYQFWRCRHNAFRGDGAFGQFCVILPEKDAVVAMTSQTEDMQGLLNLVWEHLLPAMNNDSPPQPDTWQHLRQRLGALTLAVPTGQTSPATSGATPASRPNSVYTIEPNDLGITRLSIASHSDTVRLTFEAAGQTHTITNGLGSWHDGETELPGTPPQWVELVGVDASPRRPSKIAAAGAWKDPQTFEMQWRYYETPHFDIVTIHFIEGRIEVTFQNSLTLMSPALHAETRPVLKGVASA